MRELILLQDHLYCFYRFALLPVTLVNIDVRLFSEVGSRLGFCLVSFEDFEAVLRTFGFLLSDVRRFLFLAFFETEIKTKVTISEKATADLNFFCFPKKISFFKTFKADFRQFSGESRDETGLV